MAYNLAQALEEANERKYDRIVKCKYCGTPGLIFDTSKSGNQWLYEASAILTDEELNAIKDPENVANRFEKFLREVVLGRDADGNLGTGFVLVFKHKPHPACRLEAEMAEKANPVEPTQDGTIDVSRRNGKNTGVVDAGIAEHPDDQAQDEDENDKGYDGTLEPETSEEYMGLTGYVVSDDED